MIKLTPAPQALIDACGGYVDDAPKPKNTHTPTIEVNRKGAIQRATHYLQTAPASVEGEGGDANALQVAMFVKDLGVDEPTALVLMLDHWNSRCEPPWDYDELERKIANAYKYGKSAPGSNSPEADFEPIEDELANMDPKPARPPMVIKDPEPYDPAEIPKRAWLLGRHLLCTKVSVLIAPGGEGKSTLALSMACAVVTGRDDLTGLGVLETGPALVINNEDDEDELRRRLTAVRMHHKISFDDTKELYTYSGVERPFIIAKRTKDGAIQSVDKDAILNFIKTKGVKLVIADPFAETHYAEENSNEEIIRVGRLYREIAVKGNCAVLIIHHTRKPPAGASDAHIGDMNSGRGASALTGIARIMYTLYGMSAKDAKAYGVPTYQREKYVRLDDAKANLSIASNRARWFRKESVTLPNGDDMGVLVPDDTLELVELKETNQILGAIRTVLARSAKDEGKITLQQAAELAVDAIIDTVSVDTMKRRLREDILKTKVLFEGWELWHEEKDPGDKTQKGNTKYWVYGQPV